MRTPRSISCFVLLILIVFSRAIAEGAILDITDKSVPSHSRFVVRLSERAEFTKFKLSDPERFYIDLRNTTVPKRLKKELAADGLVKTIRLGQFDSKTARVVFDVRTPDYETTVSFLQNPPRLDVDFFERKGRPEISLSRSVVGIVPGTQSANAVNSFETRADSTSGKSAVAPRPSYQEGFEAEMAGHWEKALRIYRALVEGEPKRMDVWLRIADIESSLGHQTEAAEALERAVQLSPKDDRLRFKLSQAYSVSNKPKKALEEIEKAVELAPDNTEYLQAMARLANWNGKPDLAVKTYRRVLLLSPDNDAILHDLAKSEMWSGDLDRAVKDFETYTRKHPENKEAFIEYAEAEGWRGNFFAGITVLERYKAQFGETREYRKARARLLAWAHRPTQALELTHPLLKEQPDDYDLNYSQTLALCYANRPGEMIESLEKTERLRPGSKESIDLRLFTTADLRSNIEAAFRAYSDSDHVSTYTTSLAGSYFLKPGTSLKAGVRHVFLHAETGSGLENADGGSFENYFHAWIGFQHRISPRVGFEGHIGSSSAEGESTIASYYLALNLQPADSLALKFERDYDYYLVSPRTVSLGIKEGLNRIRATWQPTLIYTIDTNVSYNTLSDDNRFWEIFFGPRRTVLRSAKFNLDIGVSGSWISFEKQLNHGYYSPESYQKYSISEFGYWKINDENGISVVISEGALKDDTMSGFRLGWDAYVEGTFGIYRDWMLKATGGFSQNLRQATGAFRAYAAGVSLTHRF